MRTTNNKRRTTAPLSPRERRILTLTCYAHLMSHCNMLAFPALVLPLSSQLGISIAHTVELSFWMYLLYGISALVWGSAADRWGGRALLLLFYAGAAAGALAAAGACGTGAGLPAALAVLGLFSGIYHPVGLGWISKEIRRVSRGLALNGMSGNLGIALSPLLTGIAVRLWGVRAAFILLAAANCGGAVLMAVLAEKIPAPDTAAQPTGTRAQPLPFCMLLLAMMLAGIAYRGSTVILPAYFELKNAALFSLARSLTGAWLTANLAATMTVSLIFMLGLLGQYAGGMVAERFDLRRSYLLFHAAILPAAFCMARAADTPLVLTAAVYFFFLLGAQPIENTLVARFTPARFRHSAFGLKFVLTFGVGALAVKLVGFIQQSSGIASVFSMLGIVALLIVATIIVLMAVTGENNTARKPAA